MDQSGGAHTITGGLKPEQGAELLSLLTLTMEHVRLAFFSLISIVINSSMLYVCMFFFVRDYLLVVIDYG